MPPKERILTSAVGLTSISQEAQAKQSQMYLGAENGVHFNLTRRTQQDGPDVFHLITDGNEDPRYKVLRDFIKALGDPNEDLTTQRLNDTTDLHWSVTPAFEHRMRTNQIKEAARAEDGKAFYRFVEALHVVGNSGHQDTAENAQLLFDLVFNKKRYDTKQWKVPSETVSTEFTPGWSESGLPSKDGIFSGMDMYYMHYKKPIIIMNNIALKESANVEIQADVIRTGIILRQWCEDKTGIRQRTAYDRAFKRVAEWLDEQRVLEIRNDPRTTPKEALLETVMGERRYLLDCGFSDWQRAVDIILRIRGIASRHYFTDGVKELEEKDSQVSDDEYTHEDLDKFIEGVKSTIDATTEFIKEKVGTDNLLRSLRDDIAFFKFMREDAVSRWSARANLQAVKMLDSLREIKNPNERAVGAAIFLVSSFVGEIDANKRSRSEKAKSRQSSVA